MKPNGEELASLTGGDADAIEADPAAAARAAAVLVGRGVEAVLATLGGSGAVLVTAEGAWHAVPPPTTVVSTVGAGDSSLFGYLLGALRDLEPAERLRLAVAYGSAAAALPGTTIPTPSHTRPDLVEVRELVPSASTRLSTQRTEETMTDTSASQGMITPGLVALDVSLGSDKTEVIRALARQVAGAGRTGNADGLAEDALAREATSATGLPGGIAIPHCRTEHVDVPTLAFARLSPGTDFGAKDGPADLAFLIAAPAGGDATHLKVLTQLARALVKKEFTDGLRSASSPEEIVELVGGGRLRARRRPGPGPAAARAAAPVASVPSEAPAAPAARRSIVAVTACPTGIAHTYMAAEALEAAAARAGVDIAVETQGSAGSTPLAARRDRPRRRRDLRRRRRRPRPRSLRRQAAGRLRRQAPHGRRGLDDRRGAALRRRPGRPARRGCGRRRRGAAPPRRRRRRVLGRCGSAAC